MSNGLNIAITPEMALALEAGVKTALKDFMKDLEGDPRTKVASDQTLTGIKLDLTLEIGELKIGHDTDKAPTASIPLLPTLALLVKKMGFQRDKALVMIREAMTEAIDMDKKAAKALLEQEGVADAEKMVKQEIINQLPRVPVNKSVKAKDCTLTVTGVSQAS